MECPVIRRLVPLLLITALPGCGATKDNYSGAYVGGDNSALIQMRLVEGDDGQITGNLAVSELDYHDLKVKLTTRAVSGIRNGKQFSLVARKKDWTESDAPLSLEAKGKDLVLMVPGNGQELELRPMDQDQYRKKLEEFAQPLIAIKTGQLSD